MKFVLILSSAAMIAVLNACGKSDGGGGGGEDANGGRGAAASGDVAEFTAACLASSNLQRPICECAGRKAKAELTDDGFAFLVATLNQDKGRVDDLRGKLTASDAVSAGTFMTRGPAECAAEQAGINRDSM